MYLVFSDTHFSDKKRDEYRFELFPWLREQQELYQLEATFFLGDLTENKDKHSSLLTNAIVGGFKLLKPPIFILRGNHDCIDADLPFFKFLSDIPGLYFITDFVKLEQYKIAMISHQRSQEEFDKICREIPEDYGWMLHQTVTGAIAETGQAMTGFNLAEIERLKPLYTLSGDIHRPQQVGICTYIGAPYHVRHGDDFVPRVALMNDDGNITDLHFPAPKKITLTIRDPEDLLQNEYLTKGDQVKIKVELSREEIVEWSKIKEQVLRICAKLKIEVYGVELLLPTQAKQAKLATVTKTSRGYFNAFCNSENTPKQMRQVGLNMLGEQND